jgi:hypothetical protein
MYLVLPWYGPTVVYNVVQLATMNHCDEVPVSEWILDKQLFTILMRVFYITRIVIAPIFLSQVSWFTAMLGVPLVTGFLLTFVFVVSHNFCGSERAPAPKGRTTDFWRLQVETSCSYGGTISTMLTGGLNMQIEHHCMPRLNSWHYPRIQAAVQAVCIKVGVVSLFFLSFLFVLMEMQHGVRYVYFATMWENVMSTIKYMRFVGSSVTASDLASSSSSSSSSADVAADEMRIIVRGQSLDVSRWAPLHPGGSSILRRFADRDATEQFAAMHSPAAFRQLEGMLASKKLATPLVSPPPVSEISKEYAKLREELQRDGMFQVPVLFEAVRFASNMFFYIAGFLLMRFTNWHWFARKV